MLLYFTSAGGKPSRSAEQGGVFVTNAIGGKRKGFLSPCFDHDVEFKS
jgi:hypothetical protein